MTAAELWAELERLRQEDAPQSLRGKAWEAWFNQSIREGNDPSAVAYAPPDDRTHCSRDHRLTEDNIYIGKDGRRRCRLCRAIDKRKHREKQRRRAAGWYQ